MHVFVEKPLAADELLEIKSVYTSIRGEQPKLMVELTDALPAHHKNENLLRAQDGPKIFIMTVNAGEIPVNTDPRCLVGGGRIIGEVSLHRFT